MPQSQQCFQQIGDRPASGTKAEALKDTSLLIIDEAAQLAPAMIPERLKFIHEKALQKSYTKRGKNSI
ncbi:unnamed protein product [Caenorhabditis auriculariae]|uniref:Uncharacterized protein n=1 Tax=Caenorhabditis auriculariae TaxID=2777116 RepID=A0A8S1H3J4_9PELO|nr:unnamed protein product [Caenorhabditis auriculariae]